MDNLDNEDLKAIRTLLEEQKAYSDKKEQETAKKAENEAQEKSSALEAEALQKKEDEKILLEKEKAQSEKLQKKEEQEEAFKTSLTQSIDSILKNVENAETPQAVDMTATNEKLDKLNEHLEVISSQNQFSFYSDIAVFSTLVIAIPVFIIYKMVNSVVNRLF